VLLFVVLVGVIWRYVRLLARRRSTDRQPTRGSYTLARWCCDDESDNENRQKIVFRSSPAADNNIRHHQLTTSTTQPSEPVNVSSVRPSHPSGPDVILPTPPLYTCRIHSRESDQEPADISSTVLILQQQQHPLPDAILSPSPALEPSAPPNDDVISGSAASPYCFRSDSLRPTSTVVCQTCATAPTCSVCNSSSAAAILFLPPPPSYEVSQRLVAEQQ
jgi:hypothetical protein